MEIETSVRIRNGGTQKQASIPPEGGTRLRIDTGKYPIGAIVQPIAQQDGVVLQSRKGTGSGTGDRIHRKDLVRARHLQQLESGLITTDRDKAIADEWRVRVIERHCSIVTPQQLAIIDRHTHQRLFEAHDKLTLAGNRRQNSVAVGRSTTIRHGAFPQDRSRPLVEGHNGCLRTGGSADQFVSVNQRTVRVANPSAPSGEVRDIVFAPDFPTVVSLQADKLA